MLSRRTKKLRWLLPLLAVANDNAPEGAAPVDYAARFDFGVPDDAAPAASPHVEDGSLTLVQLDGQYSIADGLLHGSLNVSAAYIDEGWYVGPYTRAAGLLQANLARYTTLGQFVVDVRSTATIGFNQTVQGFNRQAAGLRDFNSNILGFDPAVNEWHWYTIIIKATGVIWLYDDQLVRVVRTQTTNPLYFAHSNHSSVEDHRAVLVHQLEDTFTQTNDVAIVVDAAPSANETYDAHQHVLLDVDWTPATNEIADFIVRRIDDNNCVILRCNEAANTVALYEKVGGVETLVASSSVAQTFNAGTTYHITLHCYRYRFHCFVDDTRKFTNLLAGRNYYGSGVKITSVNCTNLRVRPVVITDPNWRKAMRLFKGTAARRIIQVPTQSYLTAHGETIATYIAQLRPGDILRFTVNETYTISGNGFQNIPNGTYYDNTLIDGNGATISGGTVTMFPVNWRYGLVQNLTVLNGSQQALNMQGCAYLTLNRCDFRSNGASLIDTVKIHTSHDIVFNDCTAGPSTLGSTRDGFECYHGCHDIVFNRCIADTVVNGFEVFSEAGQGECYNITFNDCIARNCTGYGFSNEGGPESRSNPNVHVYGAIVSNNVLGDYEGIQGSTLIVCDSQAGVENGSVSHVC